MTKQTKDPHSTLDDRLADFTDQVLEGKAIQTASNVDDDLLLLEETVLHLSKTFPPVQLPEASVKQMQVRMKARMQREAEKENRPFWEKWFGVSNSRPQFAMTLAAVAVIALLAVFLPGSLNTGTSSSDAATALAPSQGVFAAAAAVVILIIFWIMRRK